MRANILGDLRAEADTQMLDSAFLETADFKTLIDTTDRPIVVGRRGTGKSALAYRLIRHWRQASRTDINLVAPAEDQVVGLRVLTHDYFGDNYRMIRAGCRVAWRYALLAEATQSLAKHYRLERTEHCDFLRLHARQWSSLGTDISGKLRTKLRQIGQGREPAVRVADIAKLLEVAHLEQAVGEALGQIDHHIVTLVDRVDEGYEPDVTGVALVDGLVLAAIDLNTRIDNLRITVFLRDNMARAVEQLDPDYSRDIEGQVLRLHWEENQLFSLICSRLRHAFSIDVESDLKAWNRCAARELQGRDGFKRCLRQTLYRPRDILSVLNEAFLVAARNGRHEIIGDDVDQTAKSISRIRLEDLHKEYSSILPGLKRYTAAFKDAPPDLSLVEANVLVNGVLDGSSANEAEVQTFELLKSASDIGAALYSVGFLGVRDSSSGIVAFCHDGRMLDRVISESDKVMVHPCYWMALGIKDRELDQDKAEEIFDDYEIRVISQAPEVRRLKLGQMIGELDRLSPGDDSSGDFEEWCHRSIKVIFAAQLTNIELHPNRNAVQRRDIVATNLGRSEFWRRILEDYESRQVVFEIKNYREVGPDDFRQMAAYLGDQYGRLGFLVTRADDETLTAERELPWVKEIYTRQQKLVVKLTGRFFSRILSKLRSPDRHDEADSQLNKLLDRYLRLYMHDQIGVHNSRMSRRKTN